MMEKTFSFISGENSLRSMQENQEQLTPSLSAIFQRGTPAAFAVCLTSLFFIMTSLSAGSPAIVSIAFYKQLVDIIIVSFKILFLFIFLLDLFIMMLYTIFGR